MKKKKQKVNNIRISVFLVIFALVSFIMIGYRLTELATSEEIDGINLQEFASKRTTKKEVLTAKRGTIYDKNGDALAENVSAYTLIAYLDPKRTTNEKRPQHVVDKEYTAKMLATVLDIDEEQLLTYLTKKGVYQTEFGTKGRGLTELTKDAIISLGLPGIDFIVTQKRYYPYGNFASYTLGYATTKVNRNEEGISEETIKGEMGIEAKYNDELSGSDGYTLYQKDRNGYKIPGTKEITVPAQDGNDVYLTIDSNIQLFVERAIDKAGKAHYFEWMTVVIADAKTGAILASSNSQGFDPNKRDISNYVDLNVGAPFEPGSTMKIFAYMAVMENSTYNGQKEYKSGVYVTKDGTKIGDWKREGWGYITFDQGFALSSNTGIINLMKQNNIDGNTLKSYYKRLGFGSRTGIELPKEAGGKVNFKYETEVLNAGFGQGITTTPIQNIKALTALTNNGVIMQPYIVDKIVDPNTGKTVYEGQKSELETVASKETVTKIKSLMRSVIEDPIGTGSPYYMKGYDIVAKTGTAQVAGSKGYGQDIIKGFAGLYPGKDPSIIIYIAAKNPYDGSTTPIKIVMQDVVRDVSKYLNLDSKKDDETEGLQKHILPSLINKSTDITVEELKGQGLNPIIIGNGKKITDQYPKAGSKVTSIDKLFLVTNDTILTMPSIIGYSGNEAKTLLNLLNINYTIDGTGYVSEVSVASGTTIKTEDVVNIVLKPRY